ncbi:MAG: DUF1592 domain-containing protein [Vicinamibacterales bacterium]
MIATSRASRAVALAAGTFIGATLWASVRAAVPEQAPAAPAATTAAPAVTDAASSKALLDKYCVTCHNDRAKTGGLSLQGLDPTQIPGHAETFEKVIRKVRAGMMPPGGMPRPAQATLDSFVTYLTTTIDAAAAGRPMPGPALIHRVNRTEYANGIRDLLGVDVDVASLLPADDAIAGFDNNAAALGSSPVLLERYLAAALKIAPLAVGIYREGPSDATYRAPADSAQTRHVEGLPFGTRGGLLIRHTFPADGEYIIQPYLWRNNVGKVRGLQYEHDLEVLVDDATVHQVRVGTREQYLRSFSDRTNSADMETFNASLKVKVHVTAGPHVIGVTFREKTGALDPQKLRPLLSPADSTDTHGVPRVDQVVVTGPFEATDGKGSAAYRKVFVCQPKTVAEEGPCAKTILLSLARVAYRRPVVDADVQPLLEFFSAGRRGGGSFEAGIERALTRILVSPEFLFRMEAEPASARAGTPYRVADLELASRLSYFLWSSLPDEMLLQEAAAGRLRNPRVLEQQVNRMLADPRADALISNFAGQWLYLRNLRTTAPVFEEFPDFDDDLRQAFKRETELLFAEIMRGNRSVLELLNADYTFVNERLAEHYGIRGVYGSEFRRVPVTDEARRGLLGHGSILVVTSNANRTSPVKRGKWILENILGTPPPPPPPNVPALEASAEAGKPRTLRETMELHRRNPSCASCHRQMDPYGFALENYDGVGAWREKDAGVPINATADLPDGTTITGPAGLRQALLKKPENFVGTVTEKLLTYALGRGLQASDMPIVRGIVRTSAPTNYRFSSLVMGIVNSTPFQMRVKPASTATE